MFQALFVQGSTSCSLWLSLQALQHRDPPHSPHRSTGCLGQSSSENAALGEAQHQVSNAARGDHGTIGTRVHYLVPSEDQFVQRFETRRRCEKMREGIVKNPSDRVGMAKPSLISRLRFTDATEPHGPRQPGDYSIF